MAIGRPGSGRQTDPSGRAAELPKVTDPVSRPDRPPRVDRRWLRLLALAAVTPVLRHGVVADAVPAGSERRTGCERCAAPIGPGAELRPLTPLGRCAGCGARVGAPPYAVEAVALGVAALVLLAGRPVPETLALLWWAGWVIPLVFIDLAVHRLPDRYTYPAAIGVLGLLGLAALTGTGDGDAWWRASAAGIGAGAFFAGTTLLLGRRGFGLGDAKLAVSTVALLGWWGWPAVFLGLFVAFTASALVSLTLLATRRLRWSAHLPFGPFLALSPFALLGLLAAAN
jgi:leader peptidase (prepilin peptidase)/N-methyltransferase